MAVTWRLVGRDEEVAFLADALDSAAHSGCVLSGRAGVGKTRLATEVADRARASDRDVEWLVATHGTRRIALGALAPALGEPPPAVSEGELLHWARRQLATRPHLVLCVDDAHLLDDASASILLQLAARREAFVVATIRSGTSCPDDLVGLWKDGWAERVEILPLGQKETADLARDFLGDEPTPETAKRLFQLSEGVPLNLRELLLAAVEEGSIADTGDGQKQWLDPLVPTARLTELVTARLGRLADEERHALVAIALGEPLDMAAVERLIDGSVLIGIEQRGLVTTEQKAGRPVVRISHPLYSEVLRAGIPAAASRELHRRLADAVEWVGYADDDLLRLAYWRLEGGDSGDPALLLAAGERALRTFDTALAERLGRAAVETGGMPRAELLVADALYYANRWDEAAAALDALTATDIDDDTRADASMLRASLLIWSAGDPGSAHDLLFATAARLTDPARRAEVDAERAWPLVVSDRLEEAAAVAAPYTGDERTEPRAMIRAFPPLVVANTIRGRTDDALGSAQRAAEVAAAMTDPVPTAQGELLAATCLALWLDGRLLECEELAGNPSAEGADDWSDGGRGLVGFIQGKAALERGHATRAVELTQPAIDALRGNDIGLFLPWAHYVLARAKALLGDIASASRSLADGDECRVPAVRLAEPDRVFAAATVSEGAEPGSGRRLLTEASLAFESWGAYPYALLALLHAVRFGGGGRSDVDRAAELAGRCQGKLAPAVAAFVRGATAGDAGDLSAVGEELESFGLDLVAAEAALLAATAFDDDGRRGTALGARQKATSLLERCGPVQTPVVTTYAGDSPLAQLTRREQEVARHVASGLTNREIATRLHVSERTVDNHVQHIFAKLGINERGALRVFA